MPAPGERRSGVVIVVADTSPINYLIQIQCDDVLPQLCQTVVVPTAVVEELRSPKAPAMVKVWMDHLPAWLEVRQLRSSPDLQLSYLGPGEREAIQLAEEQPSSLLLIDERKGRSEARRRGLYTTGTLGVLLAASDAGLLDPAQAYRRLVQETTFRTSADLESKFLNRFLP